ncbi:MAG: hypothetical protein NVS9B10_03810 [Nevskia sp.]
MQAKLIIGFDVLSGPAFLTRADLILSSLKGNANFPLPWPAQVPGLDLLQDAVTAYRDAYNAASTGDRSKIAKRDAARKALSAQLKKLAPYLEIVANGDAAVLGTAGYELRNPIIRGAAGSGEILMAPAAFRVERGELSGVLIARARNQKGAGSFEVQTTAGDPTMDANWTDAGTYLHCSHIELKGLPPGKTVSVRLRGIGTQGPGAWTPAVSLMVV